MLDLVFSLLGMTVLCLTAGLCGGQLQRRASKPVVVAVLAFVTIGMAAYLSWVWNRPLLATILPFSNAIIVGNWLPVVGAFFAGVCLQTKKIVPGRRVLLGVTLSSLCGYSLLSPVLGNAPECRVTGQGDRLLEFQTTDQTCSAACAAGLLRMHGIDATEDELARLCLTRRGTHWLGVFRGLKIKTAGTEWDVVVEEVSPQHLTKGSHPPGVLAMTFAERSAEHSFESGFASTMGHAVICLGNSEWETLEVFDPSPDYGFESWNARILADVETGIMLRLVSRKGSPSPLDGLDTNRPSTWNERRVASR